MEFLIDKDNNKIHSTALIGDNVILGKNNIIYPYAVIGMTGFIREDSNATNKILIGNNNWIGNFTSIMCGKEKPTIIGDNNLIMNYVNIGHDVTVGNDNEIGARSIVAGFAEIGNENKIKLNCTIRNRVIIKNENIIGMGSTITKNFDVEAWIIYGSPARKIKRRIY